MFKGLVLFTGQKRNFLPVFAVLSTAMLTGCTVDLFKYRVLSVGGADSNYPQSITKNASHNYDSRSKVAGWSQKIHPSSQAGTSYKQPSSSLSPQNKFSGRGRRSASYQKLALQGEAAYYSDALAGRATASGEPYNPGALTAAHRTLAFGTVVRVINLYNNRQVIVRINDRGPFGKNYRIIDLSGKAADILDMRQGGRAPVKLQILERPARRG